MQAKLHSIIFICSILLSCKEKSAENLPEQQKEVSPATEVIVASPTDTLKQINSITLNATATFLLKSDVKSNATGYITGMKIKIGDHVKQGAKIFDLQTKEARALGNTINKLDPEFRFHGATTVVSPATGYIVMLNHQVGDYVQDGETLATITDESSFGFVMDVPYEYLDLLKRQSNLSVNLPGGLSLPAKISKIMPSVDAVSQTVKVLLTLSKQYPVPENLLGTVSIIKHSTIGISVPKNAVLSDETQSSYWVMKMINSNTAVKIPIEKGVETDQYIEIKSGNLSPTDRVILSGNFGLGDTAHVKIINQ